MTYAQLAAQMLRQSAELYRAFAQADERYRDKMNEFAGVCTEVADKVEADPLGEIPSAESGSA